MSIVQDIRTAKLFLFLLDYAKVSWESTAKNEDENNCEAKLTGF